MKKKIQEKEDVLIPPEMLILTLTMVKVRVGFRVSPLTLTLSCSGLLFKLFRQHQTRRKTDGDSEVVVDGLGLVLDNLNL